MKLKINVKLDEIFRKIIVVLFSNLIKYEFEN